MNPVFVYGILKGRKGAKRGWVPNFRLIDMGAFPAAIPASFDCKVQGELIYVDDETIVEFDRIEGSPDFYKREKITVKTAEDETIEAEMYVVNNRFWDEVSCDVAPLSIRMVNGEKIYTYGQTV